MVPETSGDRFTAYGSDALERAVHQEVHAIGAALADVVPDDVPFAILLGGGFGRGEGTAALCDGRLGVQNDYDFEILVDVSISRFAFLYSRLSRRAAVKARKLAAGLKVKQIDIGIKCVRLLARSPPTIALYELASAHHFVTGDRSLVGILTASELSHLPPTEGSRLLMNRGAGFLIPALYLLLVTDGLFCVKDGTPRRTCSGKQDSLRGNDGRLDRQKFLTEVSKALLACGDVILLCTGSYHFSYRERARRLEAQDAFAARPRLGELYREALAYKLKWDRAIGRRDPALLWHEARRSLLDVWREFESWRLGRRVTDWRSYGRLTKPRHEPLLLDMGRVVAFPSRLQLLWKRGIRWLLEGHEATLLSLIPALLEVPELSAGRLELPEKRREDWLREVAKLLQLWHPAGEAGRLAALARSAGARTVDAGSQP